MTRWLAGCAAFALVFAPALAQETTPPTTITPDTLPSFTTGTTAIAEGSVTTIGGGVRAGDNLFHSFSRFDLGPADIARWTANDALTIRNVINRVTGGERSFIAGTIDASQMPDADFYFINPAGIVLGDGAAVDVGGTAHFSTAQHLGFADGTVLVSGTASGSSFSMAEPARFGFLGSNAAISLVATAPLGDEIARGVAAGRIAMVASDIAMEGSSLFATEANLRAVGQGRGHVGIGDAPDQGLRGGRIALDDSRILLQDDGRIDLVAGMITLDTFSEIGVTARAGVLPSINVRADLVDLISGELRVSGIEDLAERSGDIRVTAGQIMVRGRGAIRTESRLAGGGGTIFLEGDRIEIDEGTVTATGLSAPGRSVGDIQVRGGLLRLTNTGLLSTTLFQARGEAMPTGTTGNILIDVTRLEMADRGLILASSSSSTASGPGSVTIRADSISIGQGLVSTSTDSATAAGTIDITVRGLMEMNGFGGIQSISQGLGNAGAIIIQAGTLRMTDIGTGAPVISSETELPRAQEFRRLSDYTGSAGTIAIRADRLEMIGLSSISTSSSSLGNGGDISIFAGQLTMTGDAEISSAARKLLVPPSAEDFEADPDLVPELRVVPGPGRAGRVLIAVTGALAMTGGTISTATEGFGAAGEVTVAADRIQLGRGSQISSSGGDLAPGQAGTVALIARQIVLADGAEVTTSSANASTAGGIALAAEEEIRIIGAGSRIASTNTASSGGAAGNIIVGAPRITLGPGGTITTSALTGAAGQIELLLPETGVLRLAGGANPAAIATSSGPGTGGRIVISRPYALIADGARIEALGQQRGANVQLATDFFIRSADNSNLLLVDGDLVVDSQVGNVSSGIDTPDISFGDAAGVLAGQCRAARSSGSVSRLAIDQVGPLALDALDVSPSGGCR
ncbi:MAG: filamentous hemagglutinin N-terminal domain-containing protein [Sphingomonas sp.]